MCRLPSHLSKHPVPYITSCCHCIIATHYERKQRWETSAGTVTTQKKPEIEVHSDSTFSHFTHFIGLSKKWSLAGKAMSWELLCFTLIAFRLIFYTLFWSLHEIVVLNHSEHQLEDCRDHLLIFLLLYLQSEAITYSEMGRYFSWQAKWTW